MTIYFFANDPSDVLGLVEISPHGDRPADVARFGFREQAPSEGRYPTNSSEFLYWQCREAAHRALATWERIDNRKLKAWIGGARVLQILPAVENDRPGGAFSSSELKLKFYQFDVDELCFRSGASTDVVSHEVGHAILDALRPDITSSNTPEVNAFCEAFSDCLAVLTALSDVTLRTRLVSAAPDLRKPNFVEAIAEDVAIAVSKGLEAGKLNSEWRRLSTPRHAQNGYHWRPYTDLPESGDAGVLSREPHCFAQVFLGCFWDIVSEIFASSPRRDQQALDEANTKAGQLLASAVRKASPLSGLPFFTAVGFEMLEADRTVRSGANIRRIFSDRNMPLDLGYSHIARRLLRGPAPNLNASSPSEVLADDTVRELSKTLGYTVDPKWSLTTGWIGAEGVAQIGQQFQIALGSIDDRLRGVDISVDAGLAVGGVDGQAVLYGDVSTAEIASTQALLFVKDLVARGKITFDGVADNKTTHRIVAENGRRVLKRYQFE